MYAEERQQAILDQARAHGRVDVAALAEDMKVTAETIRRDLTLLERAGVLRRVHGGAIPVERIGFEPAFAARDAVLTAEKERIGKAALAEVPNEGAVILDAGTTTARLAQVLLADHTKIGNDYLARFGSLSDVDLLITDAGLDDDLVLDLETAGLRVVRA